MAYKRRGSVGGIDRLLRTHRFQASALALAPWQMLVATLLLLASAITFSSPLPSINLRGVASLAYVGPLATAFAYWAVVEVGRHIRATTISVTLLAVRGLGLVVSAFAFRATRSVAIRPRVLPIIPAWRTLRLRSGRSPFSGAEPHPLPSEALSC